MKKTILIDVTEKDIEHGIPGSWNACPVANALNRVYGATFLGYAVVTEAEISFRMPEFGRVYCAPSKILREFINDFDHNAHLGDTKPHRFKLVIRDYDEYFEWNL